MTELALTLPQRNPRVFLVLAGLAWFGMTIALAKVEDPKDIMTYGVMSTPVVVIDGKVVHAGAVPSRDKVAQWLSTVTTLATTAAASDPAHAKSF